MRRTSTLLAIAAALALASCGSSVDSTELFAEVEARYAETAYLPSYQRCVIREAEDQFPTEKLEELAELPRSEGLTAASEVLAPAEIECSKKRSGDRVIDPNASPQELVVTRDGRAEAIASGIIVSGEGSALARCVERQIKSLSDSKFIEFENASFADQATQLAQIAEPCLGA